MSACARCCTDNCHTAINEFSVRFTKGFFTSCARVIGLEHIVEKNKRNKTQNLAVSSLPGSSDPSSDSRVRENFETKGGATEPDEPVVLRSADHRSTSTAWRVSFPPPPPLLILPFFSSHSPFLLFPFHPICFFLPIFLVCFVALRAYTVHNAMKQTRKYSCFAGETRTEC
jgi:hypothetical protein